MRNYKRGDIVYIPIPNQHASGFTIRLSIILDSEQNCAIFVPCTTKTYQACRYTKHFEISKNSPEGIQMNLSEDSLVIVDRLDPFPYSLIRNKHNGTTPESILQKIEDLLDT